MKKLILLLGVVSLAGTAAAETITLSGQEGGRQPSFRVEGPWILDWSTNSEFPHIAHFELQLYDAKSGDFMGTVAELRGTGRGLKLFEDAGTYVLDIVAGNITWDIEITEVSEKQAGKMMRAKDGKPSLKDSSEKISRRVRESSFVSWRALDNETLLLFSDAGTDWRVSFESGCPGLTSVTAISFVAPIVNEDNQYDSVLLDDGTRCYFHNVSPISTD